MTNCFSKDNEQTTPSSDPVVKVCALQKSQLTQWVCLVMSHCLSLRLHEQHWSKVHTNSPQQEGLSLIKECFMFPHLLSSDTNVWCNVYIYYSNMCISWCYLQLQDPCEYMSLIYIGAEVFLVLLKTSTLTEKQEKSQNKKEFWYWKIFLRPLNMVLQWWRWI